MSERMDTEALRALAGEATQGAWAAVIENGCHAIVAALLPEGANFIALIANSDLTPERQPMRFANARLMAQTPTLAAEVLEWRELSAHLVNTIADSDLPLAQRKAVIATIRTMKQPVSEVSHG